MEDIKPDLFFDRELSWIEFNARVFEEARDPSNPVLERLKFLGIVSSNFDEFFMVRMASLTDANPQADTVRARAHALMEQQNIYFEQMLVPELESHGIVRVPAQGLNEKQMEFVKNLFFKEIFPVLTPIALHAEKNAPVLANLSLFLVLGLVPSENAAAPKSYAVIEIPKNFSRMITLPSEKGYSFILLEDLIFMFARELFDGFEIATRGLMRLTRGADLSLNEETDEDFAKVMSEALRNRSHSHVLRMELASDSAMQVFLCEHLKVPQKNVFEVKTWFDLKGISQLAFQPLFEDLKRPAWTPKSVPEFENMDSFWELLKKKDVWIHHPYQSFDYVVQFLNEAARDPGVLAIKQTLYRTSPDSAVGAALEKAIENGKRVTVLVELKARFDEEKNISWARRLEVAGATVIYGVAGYKTHAKACLVVRREAEGIKRYVHLSTGNYNEKTAHVYSDIGFFSSDEALANDMTVFFNMITGFSRPLGLSRITVAPFGMRNKIKQLIQREVLRSRPEKPGLIMAKMNSLVDPEIIQALYKASKAGVKIQLNVRGICCLKPGIKGLSENIEVRSIVDMFLEHSRIFYFQNGGDEEIYLSSADWMPRNLDRRIEAMVSIENNDMKRDLADLLKAYFKDNVKSWYLLSDGRYEKVMSPSEDKRFRVQEFLCRKAEQQDEFHKKSAPRELKPQRPQHE